MSTKDGEGTRPAFPKRAIVTAGMPYGNKGLHFGHIAGVFVPADCYARFLRDRIGPENVMFVSGTDCYGSPIDEGYRKLREQGFEGSIADYVEENHRAQKEALDAYNISLDIYEGSGTGSCKPVHEWFTDLFIRRLYENGYLEKRATAQFYDEKAQTFLNGRQVVGRCPVPGCKSEKGYADECDLGHQYMPVDLIAPKSTITGETPAMRDVVNWYFKLPGFRTLLMQYVDEIAKRDDVRDVVATTIREFLVPPIIYVKNDLEEEYRALAEELPPHVFLPAEKGKQSFGLEFEDIEVRDEARDVLSAHGLRFRTGKALVPFRLTGNIEWGVPAPQLEDEDRLTVWCWPESLWAPISFSTACLMNRGHERDEWRRWWCDPEARVYQFIGQDNIYFYGVAQTAMWAATQQGHEPRAQASPGELEQTTLIANHHVLFMGNKASSSGKVKPPMAIELLEHYTAEQLRAHFLALGLGSKSVSFSPKPYDPKMQELKEKDPARYKKVADPALKESALLTNVFNRLARSCFYAAQRMYGVTLDNDKTGEMANGAQSFMPLGTVDAGLVEHACQTVLEYERLMYRTEIHSVMNLMDGYLREANKYWNTWSKDEDADQVAVLRNAFFLLRMSAVLMHPIAPAGTEMIRDYLCFGEEFWSWEHIFEGNEAFCSDEELGSGKHAIRTLERRVDFFSKHPSQYE